MTRTLGVECNKCEWSYHEPTEPGTAANVAGRVSAQWKAHKVECGGGRLAPRHPFYVTQEGETEVFDGAVRSKGLHEVRRHEWKVYGRKVSSGAQVRSGGRLASDVAQDRRTVEEMTREAQEALQEEMGKRGLAT